MSLVEGVQRLFVQLFNMLSKQCLIFECYWSLFMCTGFNVLSISLCIGLLWRCPVLEIMMCTCSLFSPCCCLFYLFFWLPDIITSASARGVISVNRRTINCLSGVIWIIPKARAFANNVYVIIKIMYFYSHDIRFCGYLSSTFCY